MQPSPQIDCWTHTSTLECVSCQFLTFYLSVLHSFSPNTYCTRLMSYLSLFCISVLAGLLDLVISPLYINCYSCTSMSLGDCLCCFFFFIWTCMDIDVQWCACICTLQAFLHSFKRTYMQTKRQAGRQAAKLTDRPTDRQTERERERERNREKDPRVRIHEYMHTCVDTYVHTCVYNACMHTINQSIK